MAVTAPSWAPLVSFTLLIADPAAAAGKGGMMKRSRRSAAHPSCRPALAPARARAVARPAGVLRLAPLPDAALDRARDLVEHPVGLLRATSRSATARSSAPACTRRHAGWRASTGRSCGRCRSPRAVAALLGVALGAVVFRVKARARRAVRAAHAGGDLRARARSSSTRRSTAARASRSASVPVPKIGPDAVLDLLPAGAGRGRADAAGRLGRSRCPGFGAGLFAIHDDEDAAEVMGVPTYRYKLIALAHLVRAGRRGRRHPCAVPLLRDGRRGVHDHGAADGGADERARRHAALGRPGRRRGRDHAAALQLHRRPTTRSPARR